jgi:hypothetical protein
MIDAPDYKWGDPDDEQARVAYSLNLFHQLRMRRVVFEGQWEEEAALCWPEYRNTFTWLHERAPGDKQTQYQLDSHGSIASHRFGAVCDSLITPHTEVWTKYTVSDRKLKQNRDVKLFLDELNEVVWAERYKPEANFVGQNQINWQALGVFGNAGMFVDQFYAPHMPNHKGLSYQSCSPGEIYTILNFQGRVEGFFRAFKRNARNAYQMWGDKCPPVIMKALEGNSQHLFNFLHFVHPRTDWSPFEILTPKGKPYSACYISVEGHCIMEEGGYYSFPLPFMRYMVAPEEEYGRGPAGMVLPALKTKNTIKRDYLATVHQAGRPTYLIGDDGNFDFKSHPGAFNYGAPFTADGHPLVQVLPNGKIEDLKDAMAEEGKYVDDAFLVSLFQLLFSDLKSGQGQKTAREVVEYAAERGLFLSPTLGARHTDYIEPMGARELDILSYLGKLPKMPDALREAGGEVNIVPCGPLARAAQAQEAAGSLQTLEAANQVAAYDPTIYDIFELHEIFHDVGESRGMPERHFASMEKMAAKAKQRAQQAEREAKAKEMPAQAAIMKAQAIVAKAQTGGNTGGTLSGTPQGGMPQIPGNPAGQPGQPGMSGRPA